MRNGRGTIGLEEEKKGKYFAVPANSCKVSQNYIFYHDEYLASNPDCRVNMYVPVDRTSVPLLI